MSDPHPVRAILFDKDGTLFDFTRSWYRWTSGMLLHFAHGDEAHASRVAEIIGIDWRNRTFHPWCTIIHGMPTELLDTLMAEFPGWDRDTMTTYIHDSSRNAEMVAYFPLHPLLDFLRNSGLTLGVATNDFGDIARDQLHDHRIDHLFATLPVRTRDMATNRNPACCWNSADKPASRPPRPSWWAIQPSTCWLPVPPA